MKHLVLALTASLLGGCMPWYHADERRAILAEDAFETRVLLERCAAASGEESVACYDEALERDARNTTAQLGLAERLRSLHQLPKARAVLETSLDLYAALPSPSAEEQTNARAMVVTYAGTFADQGMPGVGLERAALLARRVSHVPADVLSLAVAATLASDAFAPLKEADDLATAGDARGALERYADWLAKYGAPDVPIVQAWADHALEPCLPLLGEVIARAERAAQDENWVAALANQAAAFRYLTRAKFEELVADRMLEASSHVRDPSLQSPTASDEAAAAEAAIAKGDVGAALQGYRRAIAAAPYWAEAHHNLAIILASQGVYGEAAYQMKWFLDLDPSSPLATKATELEKTWRSLAPPAEAAP